MNWIWWVGAALLLAVVEILSLDLVLIMLAGGALAGALLAALGVPLAWQIVGFALTSGLLLFAMRPWLLRHLRRRVPLVETNVSALVGRSAVAVAQVTDRAGRVKLAGEVWTARTENDEVVEVGDEAVVVRIMGATAVVTSFSGAGGLDRRPRTNPGTNPGTIQDSPTEESAP